MTAVTPSKRPATKSRKKPAAAGPTEAELAAVFAGPSPADLVYVSDEMPGIRRRKTATSFRYVDPAGKPVRDAGTLARIKRLVIPPAWVDVWVCAEPLGHLQATGRDARGRKQYRYHELYRRRQDETKYEHTLAFAEALPALRTRVNADLSLPGLPRDKVLATVVRLLEMTLIRVGNEEYRKANNSIGLTTMRKRHVEVEGTRIRFEFRGKSGKHHSVSVRDRRLATVIKRCQDIKGYPLFQYVDDAGERRNVNSGDVNAYLRETMGREFTAKDFRTWAGTVLASVALKELEAPNSDAETKRNLVAAIETVSKQLGNTPAVCRKCYVHPDIIASYTDGDLIATLARQAEQATTEGLDPEEAAVLAVLRKRLKRAARKRKQP